MIFEPVVAPYEHASPEIPAEHIVHLPRDPGPRPWCATCHHPVDNWIWDRYEGGFWGFTVWCHDECMGGLVPSPAPGMARLEVFRTREPMMSIGPWWWCDINGGTVQESRRYISDAAQGSPWLRWLRRNQQTIVMVVTLSPFVAAELYALFRRMLP